MIKRCWISRFSHRSIKSMLRPVAMVLCCGCADYYDVVGERIPSEYRFTCRLCGLTTYSTVWFDIELLPIGVYDD